MCVRMCVCVFNKIIHNNMLMFLGLNVGDHLPILSEVLLSCQSNVWRISFFSLQNTSCNQCV